MLEVLQTAREVTGAAIILITHDLGVVAGFADRVAVMYAGKLVETGAVDDVYYRPRMPYTLGLLGSIPRLDQGERSAADADRGHPAVARRPAGRLPVRAALPDARRRSARTIEPDLDPVPAAGAGHRSACHRSDEIERGQPERRRRLPARAHGSTGGRRAAAPRDARTGARGRRPGQAVPADEGRGAAPARRHGPRRRRHQLRHPRGRDARAGRRVGLRQDDHDHGDPQPGQADGRPDRRARQGHRRRCRRHEKFAVRRRPAGRVPGPDGVARPAAADRRHPGRAAARHTASPPDEQRRRVRELLATGRAAARAREPLSAGVLRRPAAAHRHRPGARAASRSCSCSTSRSRRSTSRSGPASSTCSSSCKAELGLSYLFVAHDLSVVRHIADRVAVMYLGRIVEIGEVDEVFERPAHPYTQALLSAIPLPDPVKERQRRRIVLDGRPAEPREPAVGLPVPHALPEVRQRAHRRRANPNASRSSRR